MWEEEAADVEHMTTGQREVLEEAATESCAGGETTIRGTESKRESDRACGETGRTAGISRRK